MFEATLVAVALLACVYAHARLAEVNRLANELAYRHSLKRAAKFARWR